MTPLEVLAQESERRIADLQAQVAEIVSASESANADDEHDPEGATIAFERAALLSLLAQAIEVRREVGLALERVRQGTYGLCSACGAAIPAGRLAARPTASTCIACASAIG